MDVAKTGIVKDKKQFLELMNKGWEKSRYTSGNYSLKKTAFTRPCGSPQRWRPS